MPVQEPAPLLQSKLNCGDGQVSQMPSPVVRQSELLSAPEGWSVLSPLEVGEFLCV